MFKKSIENINLKYEEDMNKLIDVLTAPRDKEGNRITASSTDASKTESEKDTDFKIEPSGVKADFININDKPINNIDEAISAYIHYYFEVLSKTRDFLFEKSKDSNGEIYRNKISTINNLIKIMRKMIDNKANVLNYIQPINFGKIK